MPPIQTPSAAHVILLAAALLPSFVRATCYWQNSTLAPDLPYSIAQDDTACFPDQDQSPCCGTGWTCLSDGVCKISQEGQDYYYRGTCTDRSWNSQLCSSWCFAQNSNTSIPLGKCDTDQDWYCCPGDPDCDCSTGKNVVKLGADQPTTVTVIGSTTWSGMETTSSPFTEQPLNTAGTSTEDASGAFSATGTGVLESAVGAATSPATSPSESAASDSSNSGSSNTGLAAGLGAGLGAAAVLVAGLIWFLIRSRRKKRNAAALAVAGEQSKGAYSPVESGTPNASHEGYYGAESQRDAKAWSGSQPSPPVEMPGGQGARAELGGSQGDRPELAGSGSGRQVHEMQG